MRNVKTNNPKMTKRLQEIFDRYHVTLRHTDTLVEHLTYRKQTVCSPLIFAIYEAAIKSNFWNFEAAALSQRDDADYMPDSTAHRIIAARHGFDLVELIDPTEHTSPERQVRRKGIQSGKDYHYCARKLMDIGLYYALSD